MSSFHYARVQDVAQARAAFDEAADPRYLAGGQTLLPVIKQRLAAPDRLIALRHIPELKGVCAEGDHLVIGAMTTHAALAGDATILASLPALACLAAGIGDPHVRNLGTLGGALANNDPSADYPAAVLALGGIIETDQRRIEAADFFVGMFTTALEPGELIKAVRMPRHVASAYAKFPNPASGYALVGVFIAQHAAGDVRVAITGAGDSVYRHAGLEAALNASLTPDAIDAITIDAEGLASDLHASAAYRAHLISVLAKRALAGLPKA
ncbi:MAG: xanthine dehydrogenase family protein subunit M [Pseudomonadota bacterium]